MNSERRQMPRARMKEIVYLQMEPENGGLVLNLSETGLAFQAATPVRKGEIVRFWFSLPSGKEVRAVSEVAWTDETLKTGGLKFTFLPEGARQQIRKWIDLPRLPIPAPEAEEPVPVAVASQPALAAPSLLSDVPPAPVEAAPPGRRKTRDAFGDFEAFPPTDLTEKKSASLGVFALGSLTGVLLALIVTGLFLFYSNRLGTLTSLVQPTQAPGELDPAPPAASPAAPAVDSSPGKANGETNRNPSKIGVKDAGSVKIPGTTSTPEIPALVRTDQARTLGPGLHEPSVETTPSARQGASGQINLRGTQDDGDDGRTELAAAERYLNDPNRSRDAIAAALLWQAVSKGNASAEMMLAELYLRGAGVSRSCEQARVLVTAAAQRGNELAEQKLRDFPSYGCR